MLRRDDSFGLAYAAAHAGFAAEAVPLGGGGAVADALIREWAEEFVPLEVLNPAVLGASAPTGRDLVRFDERAYARFCHEFSSAVTERILRGNPSRTRVLINDISEAPDFARLAKAGFALTTIYHVDVVAYVAKIYARDIADPVFLARLYDWFAPLYPRIAKLVFEKQKQSLEHSRLVVVPSRPMRDLLLACYPGTPPARIRVLPWGHWSPEWPAAEVAAEVTRLRSAFGIDGSRPVVLTLSRLSPEKGQDQLISALAEIEARSPVDCVVCGDAAYMMGVRFKEKLEAAARRLKRSRVIFPGHVTGITKRAWFALADLYVFPSRHESYGLTLLEALAAGLPAVCLDHHGARAVMRPEFGSLTTVGRLGAVVEEWLHDPERRQRAGAAARAWASTQRFSATAATLARWIRE